MTSICRSTAKSACRADLTLQCTSECALDDVAVPRPTTFSGCMRFNNSDLCLFTNLEDDSEWYVQMQESSMRNELLLQTVNRNTGELQQILKGLLQAVHSTHELNKTMVEQQSKMNSTLSSDSPAKGDTSGLGGSVGDP
ncbi:hypothetical protein TKK_0016664 [Trichogramma kaykai]